MEYDVIYLIEGWSYRHDFEPPKKEPIDDKYTIPKPRIGFKVKTKKRHDS